MSSEIDAAFVDLNTQLETHFGEAITYTRTGTGSESMTAVWNSSRQEFDILKTTIATTFTKPMQGDLITRSNGMSYDVALEYDDDNGAMLPAYDIADGSDTIWRIHVEPVQA